MAPSTAQYKIVEIVDSDDYSVWCHAREVGKGFARLTALKVLRRDAITPEMLARAHDEAKILARVRHPNIVSVFKLLTYGGTPVLEMEVIPGRSLEAVLRSVSPQGLPALAGLEIARRVAGALQLVHSGPGSIVGDEQPIQIIHRNISPKNIIVTTNGRVKLINFMLARGKFKDRRALSIQNPFQFARAVAPELIVGETSTATDTYALAVTLYQLLAGKPIRLAVSHKHDSEVAEDLSRLSCEGISKDSLQQVRSLLAKMLRFDPEGRPSHADVADTLAAIIRETTSKYDLVSFGRTYVSPMWEGRKQLPPDKHPEWGQVAFLHTQAPDPPLGSGSAPKWEEVDKQVREMVKDPGWTLRLQDFKKLMVESGHYPLTPFVEVIDRALAPGWKLWVQRPSAEEVASALILCAVGADEEILRRAEALLSHESPRVIKSAKRVIEQGS